jgi:hypothetical protein
MNSNHQPGVRGRLVRWLGFACCVVLIGATIGQALDSCDLGMLRLQQQVAAHSASRAAPTYCVVCAASHSAPLFRPAVLAPILRTSETVATAHRQIRLSPHLFVPHVRPPPAV